MVRNDIGKQVLQMLRSTKWTGLTPEFRGRKKFPQEGDKIARIYIHCRGIAREIKQYASRNGENRVISFSPSDVPEYFNLILS